MHTLYSLMQIETPRLIIRPVQLGDEYPLNQAIHNTLPLLQQWQVWAQDPSLEATSGFVQRGVFAWLSGCVEDFPMVVIHKTDNTIIGASGFNDRSNLSQGLYEIGYWCDKAYQGQGLVTELAHALTRYALLGLNGKRVVISMQIYNTKSQAIPERLNFIYEGIKPRDPIDCVSKGPEQDYSYAMYSTEKLPHLDVTWQHRTRHPEQAQAIAWAKAQLKLDDERAFIQSEVVQKTPWSTVMKFNTGERVIYLKQMPAALALEADILQFLKTHLHAPVPAVIAQNRSLHCFMMEDAGSTLRGALKKQFDVVLMSRAIEQFAGLQLRASTQVNVLLDMGVPDWRLDKLPVMFKTLLSQKNLLISDGLSETEIAALVALIPSVESLCDQLSQQGINQTLVQCDFHDNNILIDREARIRFIDLGEVVISHPLFSLIGYLKQLKKHHGLTDTSDAYITLKQLYLKQFLPSKSNQTLEAVFEQATLLWYVYETQAQYRLIQACDHAALIAYQHGKLCTALKAFILASR